MPEKYSGGRGHFWDYWEIIRRRLSLVVSLAAIIWIGVIFFTLIMPPVYQGQVKIRLGLQKREISPFSVPFPYRESEPVRYYQTQAEIIKSNPVLMAVINELKLDSRWFSGESEAREKTLKKLRNSIRVTLEPTTSLLILSARAESPELAAGVANALVREYKLQRLRAEKGKHQEALVILRAELEKARRNLIESESTLHAFQKEKGLSFHRGEVIDKKQLSELYASYLKGRIRRIAKEVELGELKKLSPDKQIEALMVMTDNSNLKKLLEKEADAEIELMGLEEKYLARHPRVKEVKAEIGEIKKKLGEITSGLLSGLETEYKKLKAEEDAMGRILGETKEEDTLLDEKRNEYQRFSRQVETEREVVLELQKRIREEMVLESLPKLDVEIVDWARVDKNPIRPKKFLNILLGLLAGAGVGVGMAFFFDYLDVSIRSVEEIERYLELPVLAVIPKGTPLIYEEDLTSPHLEPYRMLRAGIELSQPKERFKSVLLTSRGAGEGKSTTLINLGVCMARMGDRVLLIDPDFRRPALHTMLKVANEKGLVNILLDPRQELSDIIQPTSVPNLSVIPIGSRQSRGISILNSMAIRDLLGRLADDYDYLLLDSPPILGVSDTLFLASAADRVLLVVEYQKYARSTISQAKNLLIKEAGVNWLGTVLNKVVLGGRARYSPYYYDYDFYRQSGREGATE